MSRQNKNCELRVRMTEFELEKLKELSDERRMSVSELVRYLARQQWEPPINQYLSTANES